MRWMNHFLVFNFLMVGLIATVGNANAAALDPNTASQALVSQITPSAQVGSGTAQPAPGLKPGIALDSNNVGQIGFELKRPDKTATINQKIREDQTKKQAAQKTNKTRMIRYLLYMLVIFIFLLVLVVFGYRWAIKQ